MNNFDVIVVGAGGAGHCAAISAAQNEARVLVLEAGERVGGTTATAGGVIYAAGTSVQRAAGIDDDAEKMFEHYMTFNQWRLDPSIVRRYCEQSGPTIEWLISLGVEYPTEKLYLAGVELGTRRGHMPEGFGYGYINTLHNQAASRGVEFVCNTKVEGLIIEGGRVAGVVAGGHPVRSSAVILACGGLGGNVEMLKEAYPDAARYGDWHFYGGVETNEGGSILLGRQAGAVIARSTYNRGVLLRAPHFNNKELEGAALPGWMMIVNKEGRRFVNEMAPYAVMDDIINAQTGSCCFAVLDQRMVDEADGTCRSPSHPQSANWETSEILKQVERGRVIKRDSLAELANALDIHAGALITNVERYNRFVSSRQDEQFFKNMQEAKRLEIGPFYGTELRAAVMVCSSAGVEVDVDGRVEDESDRPIHGLFAVGEAAGGIVGKYLGGGNSIGSGAIFGRIAGKVAALTATYETGEV